MNATNQDAPERSEIENLLPWHAAGTLSRRDTQRVEDALARDPELARRYALVRDELGETIHLNETLGAPSPLAMEKLFAKIDAEPARRQAGSFNLGGRVSEFFASLSPRTLAWSGGQAPLRSRSCLQAGLLADIALKETKTAGYQTASASTPIRVSVHLHSFVSRRRHRPTTSPSSSKPTSCRSQPDRWPAGYTRSVSR